MNLAAGQPRSQAWSRPPDRKCYTFTNKTEFVQNLRNFHSELKLRRYFMTFDHFRVNSHVNSNQGLQISPPSCVRGCRMIGPPTYQWLYFFLSSGFRCPSILVHSHSFTRIYIFGALIMVVSYQARKHTLSEVGACLSHCTNALRQNRRWKHSLYRSWL